MNFHDHLGHWETFYVLIGTAGATLAGLTFVAITSASALTANGQSNFVALRSHLDPSVVAFTMALITSCVLLMPTLTPQLLGLMLLGCGLYLGGYTLFIVRQLRLLIQKMNTPNNQYRYDMFDRVFYMLVPSVSSLLLLICGVMALLSKPEEALSLLGVTLLALIVMGIRNALDMLMVALSRAPSVPEQSQ